MHAGLSARLGADAEPPLVMGIVNVTPDSFSDGGRLRDADAAVSFGLDLVAAGADIVDVGGESTRPGADDVSLRDELARVLPVIGGLVDAGATVSVDTSKPEVMRQAVAAGAGMINDVNALRASGALEVVADLDVPVCLMHMLGTPRTMQQAPVYGDVVAEVRDFLLRRVDACMAAGITRERVILDPGFGFGKTVMHNLQLLHSLSALVACDMPILVGLSRKSLLQTVTERAVSDRLWGSLALATIAVWHGARIVRAHDVEATVDAVKVAHATRSAGPPKTQH